MPIPTLESLSLEGKRVFVRVDFNVPLSNGPDGPEVEDDTRIREALPTIRAILKAKGRLILASHLGRPKGKPDPKFSLRPVGSRLSELLDGQEVIFPDDCIGDGVLRLAQDLRPGQVMLLENLRYHAEEEKNDSAFAQKLASIADVYINDAFGAAHRAHASTAGIAAYVREKAMGYLMDKEVRFLSRLVDKPEKPYVAILGGAKVADKIEVLENLLERVDTLLIGGGMAFTFIVAARDLDRNPAEYTDLAALAKATVGDSLFEADSVAAARKLLLGARARNVKVVLPTDAVCAAELKADAEASRHPADRIPAGLKGLDIGPATVAAFEAEIATAWTLFWNGPLGVFEMAPFANGTLSIAKAFAASSGLTVAGGGDTVSALNKAAVADRVKHVSTGGGASLEFVQGLKLPGLIALESSSTAG